MSGKHPKTKQDSELEVVVENASSEIPDYEQRRITRRILEILIKKIDEQNKK